MKPILKLTLYALAGVFLCLGILCASGLSTDHDSKLLAKNAAKTDAKKAFYVEEYGPDNIYLKDRICFLDEYRNEPICKGVE